MSIFNILSVLRVTASNASRVLAIVEVSVRPSVTPLSLIKTVQARITKSSLWAAPRTLVFVWQNFVPLCERVLLERRRQRGVLSLKRRYFTVIGSSTMKTIAHRYKHAFYHNKHWWRDF